MASAAGTADDHGRLSNFDRHISARIRERRMMIGATQQDIARRMGVSYQQFHKYESGVNRVSAGRLLEIADVLGVEPSYFFEGLDRGELAESAPRRRLLIELSRNFARITQPHYKEAVAAFTRAIAKLDAASDNDE